MAYPSPANSSWSSRKRFSRRADATTRAPSRANAIAMARPIPLDAPAISTFLSLSGPLGCVLIGSAFLRQFLHPDIAEFDARTLSQKPDMAGRSRESRMLLQDLGLANHVEVSIQDHHAVQYDGDAASIGRDLFLVPLAQRLAVSRACRNRIVDRAVILLGPDLAFVHGIGIVQNLDLHALISGVAFVRRADADSVVGARRQQELEPEDEVRVF